MMRHNVGLPMLSRAFRPWCKGKWALSTAGSKIPLHFAINGVAKIVQHYLRNNKHYRPYAFYSYPSASVSVSYTHLTLPTILRV